MKIFTVEEALKTLQNTFGFDSFLPGQNIVIKDILEKKNVVAIMPTGAGKSLLYQLPAIIFSGTVIVISPLISLMKDQVDSLHQKGVKAVLINSTLTSAERQNAMYGMQAGHYDIVYISPERLQNQDFQDILRKTKIAILAVDEAHCISQWGHDFRPDYLKIKAVREMLDFPQTIALTATATQTVRKEIAERLGLESWSDHIAGFDRDNLYFSVIPSSSKKSKINSIKEIYNEKGSIGIVYASTRKNVQYICNELQLENIKVQGYHAGLPDQTRTFIHNAFLNDELDIIVATNAFGMGIDKPNIRFVVHFDIPSDMESYYQEIGRAGRDRKNASCYLLFNYADTRIPRFFIDEAHPPKKLVLKIWDFIQDNQVVPYADELIEKCDISSFMAARHALGFLEKASLITKANPGDFYVLTATDKGIEYLNIILQNDTTRKEYEEQKLTNMIQYAYHTGCRRLWILDYFGDEKTTTNCQACDNCEKKESTKEVTGEDLTNIQKALSAVARLNGCIGKTRIAQILVGSKTKEALSFTDIPTYGALNNFAQANVSDFLEHLIGAGYLEIRLKDGKYPLIGLTSRGREVMMTKEKCFLAPKQLLSNIKKGNNRTSKKTHKPVNDQISTTMQRIDEQLYEKLREVRTQISNEIKKPAFVVFHNKTLEELASKKPRNLIEMSEISGIGKVKLEKYGEEILEVITEHTKEK